MFTLSSLCREMVRFFRRLHQAPSVVPPWVDENSVPSLEFGGWHTHADFWDADPDVGLRRMLDYLERITAGEVVLAELPTVADGMPYRVVDLLDRQEVLDELTAPTIPSDMKLLSWSGAEDVVLDDLREGLV